MKNMVMKKLLNLTVAVSAFALCCMPVFAAETSTTEDAEAATEAVTQDATEEETTDEAETSDSQSTVEPTVNKNSQLVEDLNIFPINAYDGVGVFYYTFNFSSTDYSEPIYYMDEQGGMIVVQENRITLNNVNIDKGLKIIGSSSGFHLFSKATSTGDFVIELIGNNTIESHSAADGILLDADVDRLIFTGGGSLTVSDYTTGIAINGTCDGVVFDGVDINLASGSTGLDVRNCDSDGFMVVANSGSVQINGSKAAIMLPSKAVLTDAFGNSDMTIAIDTDADGTVQTIDISKFYVDSKNRLTYNGKASKNIVEKLVVKF